MMAAGWTLGAMDRVKGADGVEHLRAVRLYLRGHWQGEIISRDDGASWDLHFCVSTHPFEACRPTANLGEVFRHLERLANTTHNHHGA